MKAPHCAEIPFAFDNVDKGPLWLGTDKETFKLGSQISTVWTTFARTGDPNTKALAKWKPYNAEDRTIMYFDAKSEAIDNYRSEVRQLLQV